MRQTDMPHQPLGFSRSDSKVSSRLKSLKDNGRAAFIGYLPFGFPTEDESIDAMVAMVESGVDIVEIGLPYSDPVMDGPVIQDACSVALRSGAKIKNVFKAVEAVARAGAVPMVMSYWNLVFHYGVENFAHDFSSAGGAGLITPDLIPDEAGEWIEISDRYGLDRTFLVSPDTVDARLELISESTRGFVYAASHMGVTGAQDSISSQAQTLVERTRRAGAHNVCVGIGVSTPEQVTQVAAYADGVIVGSALVKSLRDGGIDALRATTCELADGIHGVLK